MCAHASFGPAEVTVEVLTTGAAAVGLGGGGGGVCPWALVLDRVWFKLSVAVSKVIDDIALSNCAPDTGAPEGNTGTADKAYTVNV
jgi:hypothetical protein